MMNYILNCPTGKDLLGFVLEIKKISILSLFLLLAFQFQREVIFK